MLLNEPQVLDAARAWPESQAALRGSTVGRVPYLHVPISWYGTSVSPFEGAFCVVDPTGPLKDLVGDVLEIRWRKKVIYVYCVGSAGLALDISLSRAAYFWLTGDLARDEIKVRIAVV